jgi:hypothetical protein
MRGITGEGARDDRYAVETEFRITASHGVSRCGFCARFQKTAVTLPQSAADRQRRLSGIRMP